MGSIVVSLILLLLIVSPASATSWYVRPSTGSYGDADGTTYAKAFDGFDDVTWGVSGVVAGDTLFICGTFFDEWLRIGESGTAENRINIYSCTIANGASNDDPAIVWGATKIVVTGWTGPTDGVYSKLAAAFNGAMVVNSDKKVLDSCENAVEGEAVCCIARTDSFYYDSGTLYYHPAGDIKELYTQGYSALTLNGKSHINVKGGEWYMGHGGVVQAHKDGVVIGDMTLDGMTVGLANLVAIGIGSNAVSSSNITIQNCTIFDSTSGVYNLYGQVDNVLISGNEFYHTASYRNMDDDYNPFLLGVVNGDRCAIASQPGMSNATITNNYIHDWQGEGIFVYLSPVFNGENILISKNRVFMDSSQPFRWNMGIGLGGTNADDLSDRFKNCVVSFNIITGCALGTDPLGTTYATAIRSKLGLPTIPAEKLKVYNNTIYDSYYGFYGNINTGESELAMEFKNNIISTPQTDGYFIYTANVVDLSGLEFNKNTYYGTGKWLWDGGDTVRTDIADWKTDSSQDANSITTDPLFVSATDFHLQGASPAKAAGTNLGTGFTDFAGVSLPTPYGWPIGAYSYNSFGGSTGSFSGSIQ